MKSRSAIFLLPFLYSLILVQGASIDTTKFEAPIGSVYDYRGVFGGSPFEMVSAHLDGSSVIPGSTLEEITLTLTDPEGEFPSRIYSKNGAILRHVIVDQDDSLEINYDPPWRIGPRFVRVGQNYETKGSFTYWVLGILVNGAISAKTKIEGIETITVTFGEFEALKVSADTVEMETFPGGWAQTLESTTVWIARGIGVLREKSESSYTDSLGESAFLDYDYELYDANVALPNLTVLPSVGWYTGWNFNSFPWIYCEKIKSWIYIYGDPWVFDYSVNTWLRFSETGLEGWAYNFFPWIYSYQKEKFYYLHAPFWIYDSKRRDVFLFE